MKVKSLVLSLAIVTTLLTGCGQQPATQQSATQQPASTAAPKTDAATSASVVDNAAAFEKAISKDGKWIIAITKDLTVEKELVLDGEFKNGKKDANGKEVIQRKIALYTQDDKRNVTARFTLTAPKLTVNSPKASIQHGTFKGDVYVSAKDFQLVDATVDGNIYFTSDFF